MKKIFILVVVINSTMIFSNQMREYFLQANAAYQEGNPHDALLLYNALEKKDPAVWFNKGLCYYVLEKYPQALVAFRQAQRGANRRLLEKIEPMLNRVQDKLQVPHDGKIQKAFLWIVSLGLFLLQQLMFLLFLALCVFFICFRKNRGLLSYFLISGLVLFGFLCAVHYYVDHQKKGVIMHDKVILFVGPHKEFHGIAELHAGVEVKVVEQDQSWYKVDFHGVQGWVEKPGLELII